MMLMAMKKYPLAATGMPANDQELLAASGQVNLLRSASRASPQCCSHHSVTRPGEPIVIGYESNGPKKSQTPRSVAAIGHLASAVASGTSPLLRFRSMGRPLHIRAEWPGEYHSAATAETTDSAGSVSVGLFVAIWLGHPDIPVSSQPALTDDRGRNDNRT